MKIFLKATLRASVNYELRIETSFATARNVRITESSNGTGGLFRMLN